MLNKSVKTNGKRIARVLVLTGLMCISAYGQNKISTFSKYGAKGAPEVRIPQTWYSGNNTRTEDFTLILSDAYGDGWDGAYMDVSVNGVNVLEGITIDANCDDYYYYGCYSASFALAVDDDDLVETVYTAGSFESEHSYAFYDHLDNLVASDGPTPGTGISFTVSITSDIPGCMTAEACNYNSEATVDDGSCCLTNCTTVYVGGGTYMSEVTWEILDLDGNAVASGGGAASSEFVCFDDGDYTVNGYDSYGDGWSGNVLTVTDDDGNVVAELTFDDGFEGSTTFSIPYVENDPAILITSPIDGAILYSSDATVTFTVSDFTVGTVDGDGHIHYSLDDGTTVMQYTEDDIVLTGLSVSDHTFAIWLVDNNHESLDPPAADEVMFTVEGIAGCMTAEACNYDSDATVDDGSCCLANCTTIEVDGGGDWQSEVSWEILDLNGDLVVSGGAPFIEFACFDDGDYTLNGYDSYGDGWDGDVLTVTDNDGNIVVEFFVSGGEGTTTFSLPYTVPEIPGCMTAEACNYDPDATEDDNSCCLSNCLTMYMHDMYGDGWNGNTYTIVDANGDVVASGGLDTGAEGADELCLADGLYNLSVGGGDWQSEVSWELVDNVTGETLAEGSAPYDQDLAINYEVVWGCTDPDAENYDDSANADDGSCYYAGDLCSIALTAVIGSNDDNGANSWYEYTATINGTVVVSSDIDGQEVDTRLAIFSDCEGAGWSESVPDGNFITYNDDADESEYYDYASIVEFPITAGTTYIIFWDDYYEPTPFTWTLEESAPPTGPTDLVAEPGIEEVMLAWEPAPVDNAGSLIQQQGTNILDAQNLAQAFADKKAQYQQGIPIIVGNTLEELQDRYGSSSRDASVYFVITDSYADGYWGDGYITDADGITVFYAPGGNWGGEIAYGPILLGTGDYTVSFDEDYYMEETTWEILQAATSELIVNGDVYTPVVFNIADGGDVSLADLSVSMEYNEIDDNLYFHMENTGSVAATGFSLNIYFGAADEECGSDADESFSTGMIGGVPAGETVSVFLPDPTSLLGGYGTYTVGAFVDADCVIDESDETNNTVTDEIALLDPLEGLVWNIYRQSGTDPFAQIGSAQDEPEYLDEDVIGDVEYCYYVTQILDNDGTESDTSNHACATPMILDLLVPQNVTGISDGWSVTIEWDHPDMTNFEGRRQVNISGEEKIDDPASYRIYDQSAYPDRSRDGGDTVEDATVIDALPYYDTGTTEGYTDDYDESCPYSGSTSPDVVYSFTPASDMLMEISLCGEGTHYDTKLYVYEGAVGTLASTDDGTEACNDDYCANYYYYYYASISYLSDVMLTAGVTYYIVVDGYGGEAGMYEIDIFGEMPPSPISSYSVYRDGEMVGGAPGPDDVEDPMFSEFVAVEGDYDYYVTAWYDEHGESDPSDTVTVTVGVQGSNLYPPENLEAEIPGPFGAGSNDVFLFWDPPPGAPGWLSHSNRDYGTTIVTDGEIETIIAQQFLPSALYNFNGLYITSVGFIPAEPTSTYQPIIFAVPVGESPDETHVVSIGEIIAGEDLDMYEVNPVGVYPHQIDLTMELWVGISIVSTTGSLAGVDTGPMVPGGAKLFWGDQWIDLIDLDFDYNWALGGFIDYNPLLFQADYGDLAGQDISFTFPSGDGTALDHVPGLNHMGIVFPPTHTDGSRDAFMHYNVWDYGSLIAEVSIYENWLQLLDEDLGEHEYSVTAVYEEGESEPSNMVSVMLTYDTYLGITEITGLPGETVTLSVWADLSEDFTMYSYEISIAGFGGGSLTFLDADTAGSMTPGEWMFYYEMDEFGGIIITAAAGAEGVSSDSGKVFDLSFLISDDAATSEFIPIFFAHVLFNEQENENFFYNTEPGGVMVLEYGDVSMNGTVTAFDAGLVLQYLVGTVELDDWQVSAGDVTLDATLSALDAAIILDYVVDLIESLPYTGDGIDLAAGGDIVIPNGSVSPGDVFQMPILLDDGSNILSFELEFSYDPDVLVYQSISWNESLTGLTILDSQDDGIIKVSAAGTEAVDPGSITLGWVEFEMVDTFDDYQTTVTLTRSRLNEEVVLVDGSAGVYTNSLLVVDEWGHGGVPEIFSLEQNFPNPFNPVTQIRYQLPEQSRVSISIYDIMGRAVRTLVSSDAQLAGYRQVVWDATNDLGEPVSAGMYLYVIQAGDFRDTRKMVLMK